MKRSLLIIGAGGHGKVVAETAVASCWDHIAFLDDRAAELSGALAWPVLGTVAEARGKRDSYDYATVAVGNAAVRLRLLNELTALGYRLPAIVHPAACVSPSVQLGDGSVVFAMAAINADTRIGRGAIINTGATVDHDCELEDGVHVCPGAHLAGEVKVGQGSWIGIGSSIIQQLRIGAGVTVGAGAAVIHDIDDNLKVAGVPAKVINTHG